MVVFTNIERILRDNLNFKKLTSRYFYNQQIFISKTGGKAYGGRSIAWLVPGTVAFCGNPLTWVQIPAAAFQNPK